jgi:serine/threonine protein kinase
MTYPVTSDDLRDLVGVTLTGQGRGPDAPAEAYRLVRQLGSGGQGTVFLAERAAEAGDRAICVKIWRPSFVLAEPQVADLVLRKEWAALARLNDRVPPTPFVVRLLDGGLVEVAQRYAKAELPWLAIEYVHGGALGTTLRERVDQSIAQTGHAFSPARARRVLECIVEGVAAIHDAGIVHRDLKPTNVLVCGSEADELAKVADFGLARPLGMTSTFGRLAVGTPGYAAPEQVGGEAVGPWCDVFSVAAIAYFVLTGEDMFDGAPAVRLARAFAGEFASLPTRPKLDPAWKDAPRALARLESVLRAGTARDLTVRIPSIRELWSKLEPAIDDASSGGQLSVAAGAARTLADDTQEPWTFAVAHRPPAPLGLRAVAFDPDGHGLALGAAGLAYWEGTRWLPVPTPPGLDVAALRGLVRVGPSRWLARGDRGLLALFTPAGVVQQQSLGDAIAIRALGVASEREFVLGARALGPGGVPTGPALLLAYRGGAFLPAIPFEGLDEISAVAPAGPAEWHVVGQGGGHGEIFSCSLEAGRPERWGVESAPLLAAAADREGVLYAVGDGGFGYRRQRGGHPVLERVLSHRSLTAVAVDPSGACFAGAVGRILMRPAASDASTWAPAWWSGDHASPFVALAAFPRLVLGADEEGTVLVGRQGA